jgi:hypothetical protein
MDTTNGSRALPETLRPAYKSAWWDTPPNPKMGKG